MISSLRGRMQVDSMYSTWLPPPDYFLKIFAGAIAFFLCIYTYNFLLMKNFAGAVSLPTIPVIIRVPSEGPRCYAQTEYFSKMQMQLQACTNS